MSLADIRPNINGPIAFFNYSVTLDTNDTNSTSDVIDLQGCRALGVQTYNLSGGHTNWVIFVSYSNDGVNWLAVDTVTPDTNLYTNGTSVFRYVKFTVQTPEGSASSTKLLVFAQKS